MVLAEVWKIGVEEEIIMVEERDVMLTLSGERVIKVTCVALDGLVEDEDNWVVDGGNGEAVDETIDEVDDKAVDDADKEAACDEDGEADDVL